MVWLDEKLPVRSYDDLVASYANETTDTPHLLVRRSPKVPHQRLIVVLSTHNEGARYAGLARTYSEADADLLFLRDPGNSYYLGQDGGAAYDALVAGIAGDYAPENLLFFGSSMAGYAALRFALALNANAIVSNPQISLSVSAGHAWPDLRRNIERIARPRDLDHDDFRGRECAITLLHSRHSMDVTNAKLFLNFYRRYPGLALLTVHADDRGHKYLIPDFETFMDLVGRTFEWRSLRGKIVDWGRVPKGRITVPA